VAGGAAQRDGTAPRRGRGARLRALIVGPALVIAGVLISPLPGPGFTILAPLGLAIVAKEFPWVGRRLHALGRRTARARRRVRRLAAATPRWAAVLGVACYWGAPVLIEVYTDAPSIAVWTGASLLFPPVFYWAWSALTPPRPRRAPVDSPPRSDTLPPGSSVGE
jgi:hypothetical protein